MSSGSRTRPARLYLRPQKARREDSWTKLEQKFNAGEKVEGVIFNRVKGGFAVDLDGAVGLLLPGSQVDIRPIKITPLMNVPQPFQILKIDRARRGNIVISRRSVLEETRAEQRSEIVAKLEEGQVVDRMVKNITDYGAFIDLGGIDGLLHVTDMAWKRVNHPTEILECWRHREGADRPHQSGNAAHQPRHEAARRRSVVRH